MSAHGTAQPMTAHKSGPLKGTAAVPGDKSISHRALILGAMATGVTEIEGQLVAAGGARHQPIVDPDTDMPEAA